MGSEMCGRFGFDSNRRQAEPLESFMGFPAREGRGDLRPTDSILALLKKPGMQGEQEIQGSWLRWGLIPSWSRKGFAGRPLINARAETIDEKPSFKDAFSRRRCVVPATHYDEWQAEGIGVSKKRVRIFHEEGAYGMAGVWERWEGGEGPVFSCAIITVSACRQLEGVHPRMPAMLTEKEAEVWLDPDRASVQVKELLRPCQRVCWEYVHEEKKNPVQGTLF